MLDQSFLEIIVPWPTESYIVEAYSKLGNQHHFEQIETDLTRGMAVEIETILTPFAAKGYIDRRYHRTIICKPMNRK